jgi:hypothetical protein
LGIGAAVSVGLEQDANWDLMNYHLYNAFWILEGRRYVDIAAAGFQSFLNPLADIPYYMLGMKWLPTSPRIVAAIQGLYFGALIYAILKINAQVFPKTDPFAGPLAIIATVIGVTGAATIAEVGTTFNDIQISALVLAGVIILLPVCRTNDDFCIVRAVSAGLLFGAAAGLKFTGVIYVPAAVCAVLACVSTLRQSIGIISFFSLGWFLAFALTYGWWGWILWAMTGNPVFPFFNAIYRSDWYPAVNFLCILSTGRNFSTDLSRSSRSGTGGSLLVLLRFSS